MKKAGGERRGRAQGGRKRWRAKSLLWAVGGTAAYFAVVDFVWLLLSSGSLSLAVESGLIAIVLVLLFGWPAWLVLWAAALLCGSLALRLARRREHTVRRACFAAAIATGCGAAAYAPLAWIYGTEVSLSPFSPFCLGLATFVIGLPAAWSYYPGRPPLLKQEPQLATEAETQLAAEI